MYLLRDRRVVGDRVVGSTWEGWWWEHIRLAVVQDIGFRIPSSKGHYTTPARHAVVWTKGEAEM